MLLEFKVSNYRSIGEEEILSLIPASMQKEHPENIISKGGYKVLNAIGLYGNNASGKSNLLRSMSLFDKILHLSARTPSTTKLPYDPFLLREGWENKPTKFEISFLAKGDVKYRYGFTFNQEEIVTEWLYRKAVGREVVLFLREKDTIDVSSAFKGSNKLFDAAVEATRPNALFLSFCDVFNIEEAKAIFQWLKYFYMLDGLRTEAESWQTVSMWDKNEADRELIKKFFDRVNLDIDGLDVITKDFDAADLPNEISDSMRNMLTHQLSGKKSYTILARHRIYSADGEPTNKNISWKMEERESAGTNKIFHLIGPVLRALTHGGVLIIDEIEAKMHPLLTLDTINFFLDKTTNPKGAQLIFATHDTNLLTYSNLRRDQIYFVEKNKWESTETFSLSDFVYLPQTGLSKPVKERPDADKEKRYIEGRYGAVPVFGNFQPIESNTNGKKR
jgi:AAA15 family ATPase/GTPase